MNLLIALFLTQFHKYAGERFSNVSWNGPIKQLSGGLYVFIDERFAVFVLSPCSATNARNDITLAGFRNPTAALVIIQSLDM